MVGARGAFGLQQAARARVVPGFSVDADVAPVGASGAADRACRVVQVVISSIYDPVAIIVPRHVSVEDVQGAIGIEVSLRDGDQAPAGEADVCRGGPLGGRPVAHLAGAVLAPALHGEVVEDRAGVAVSECYGDHRAAGIEADAHRAVAVRGGAGAQFAVAAVAPALERGVVEDGAGVRVPHR